jgi:hypothetical protein
MIFDVVINIIIRAGRDEYSAGTVFPGASCTSDTVFDFCCAIFTGFLVPVERFGLFLEKSGAVFPAARTGAFQRPQNCL